MKSYNVSFIVKKVPPECKVEPPYVVGERDYAWVFAKSPKASIHAVIKHMMDCYGIEISGQFLVSDSYHPYILYSSDTP